MLYTVEIERSDNEVRSVIIMKVEKWGDWDQVVLVSAEEFGPFCTGLEISQWVWKVIARDLSGTRLAE